MKLKEWPPVILLTFLAGLAFARSPAPRDSRIERGNYLTHHVAMCVQCHTPRDEDGNLITEQEFRGAPIPVGEPRWATDWAAASVDLRGLPGWSEEEAIHFLETGERFNGKRAQPPMPPFRMSREDAEAVVAYLKSLR